MSLDGDQLEKNITISPTLKLFRKLTQEQIEDVKNFKFAMGLISGHYEENPKSVFGQKGFREKLRFLEQNYQNNEHSDHEPETLNILAAGITLHLDLHVIH